MADRGRTPGRFVASLDTVAAGDDARAGGKGANLGELIRRAVTSLAASS
jgi:phosphoenolpyruvate synthase/pyruvate phosphate dikinase